MKAVTIFVRISILSSLDVGFWATNIHHSFAISPLTRLGAVPHSCIGMNWCGAANVSANGDPDCVETGVLVCSSRHQLRSNRIRFAPARSSLEMPRELRAQKDIAAPSDFPVRCPEVNTARTRSQISGRPGPVKDLLRESQSDGRYGTLDVLLVVGRYRCDRQGN